MIIFLNTTYIFYPALLFTLTGKSSIIQELFIMRGRIITTICLTAGAAFISGIAWGETVGERYHEETKHTWSQMMRESTAPKPPMPPPFKDLKGEKMNLPKPEFKGLTIEEALIKRRSLRDYTTKPLNIAELSQLVFAAQGVTGKIYGTMVRTAPSAGALYPYEIYLLVNNVERLKKGIYHYSVRDHSIILVREGDFRKELRRACLEQDMVHDAAVNFVLVAVVDRVRAKYGERGYRYIYMEAGHISQNLYLQAASLGLGSVVIGAFIDDDMHKLLQIDGRKEIVVSIQAVGKLQ